jgi:hypothetical protein
VPVVLRLLLYTYWGLGRSTRPHAERQRLAGTPYQPGRETSRAWHSPHTLLHCQGPSPSQNPHACAASPHMTPVAPGGAGLLNRLMNKQCIHCWSTAAAPSDPPLQPHHGQSQRGNQAHQHAWTAMHILSCLFASLHGCV